MVPTAGLRDQLTAELLSPVTTALNVTPFPADKDADGGVMETFAAIKETIALAVWPEPLKLVAVTVTVCEVAIVPGAR
ncbi:MAG TPA: hypothetical protein VMH05_00755 [Bryobacteraceae bacterium]|nr:hypothetical protein [Bryobacteraceae bacterium]